MNTDVVHLELNEASIHLSELLTELRDGKISADDTPALAVQLAHIMDHMCRSWNCRNQTSEHHAELTQEEFERHSHTVPNFMGERIIGEYALC